MLQTAQSVGDSKIIVAQLEVNKKGLQAGKFVGAIAKICGGRPNLAQAGGRDASKLPQVLLHIFINKSRAAFLFRLGMNSESHS